MKPCTTCGLELPGTSYSKNRNRKDGLQSTCKQCVSVAYKARYLTDSGFRERVKARSIAQRLADPAAIKAYKKEYGQKNSAALSEKARVYYLENKDTIAPKMKAYAVKNRDKFNASNAKWAAKNPDIRRAIKMRRRGVDGDYINAGIIADLWHKQKGKCLYCRVPLGDSPKAKQAYHVDHIQPISKGGTNEPYNLQCLCPPCNLKKGAKLPHVFAQERGRLF